MLNNKNTSKLINMYRLSENYMLVVSDNNQYETFGVIESTEQLTYGETDKLDSLIVDRRINRVYNDIIYPEYETTESLPFQIYDVYAKQNYSSRMLGLAFVVIGAETGKLYCNQIIRSWDVSETVKFENALFSAKYRLLVPKVNESLLVAIKEVKFTDVDDNYILNYPEMAEFDALVNSSPLPATIDVKCYMDGAYFTVAPFNTNTRKTLIQEICEFWGFPTNSDIKIKHTISYGNIDFEQTGEGYQSLIAENAVNPLLPISFMPDLREYKNTDGTYPKILINVSTEFIVNNKSSYRTANLVWDYGNSAVGAIVDWSNQVAFPVTVTKETIIQQQVIETNVEEVTIVIREPHYYIMQSTNIVMSNKNIQLENVDMPNTALVFENDAQDIIFAKLSANNEWYYPLSEVSDIEVGTKFYVQKQTDGEIIHQGEVIENN